MKTLLAAALIATLVPPFSAHAQGKPDFSGTWRMDPSRSESAAQSEPIGLVTLVIAQTANELRMETTRTQGSKTVTYRLDGSQITIPGGTATTRWDGARLVTELVLDVQGQTVTTKETRTLAAGGQEMLVEMTLVVQHGYPNALRGTPNYSGGKDVYVRVR